MRQQTVLYLGMADDILTPFILVPSLTKLFVIDLFDSAYSKDGTLDTQQKEILDILAKGSDEASYHRQVSHEYHRRVPITRISKPTILSSQIKNNVWRIQLKLKGKDREITIFNNRDFHKPWPKQIRDVDHLMTMGAEFNFDKVESFIDKRVTPKCFYYQLSWNFPIVGTKINVRGRDISKCLLSKCRLLLKNRQ